MKEGLFRVICICSIVLMLAGFGDKSFGGTGYMCIGGTCYSVEFVGEDTAITVSVNGSVRRFGGEPVTDVNVRVVPANDQDSESAREVSVDSEGRYSVELEDGVWKVMACGSSRGFSPAFWEVEVSNGEVIGFVERRIERLAIRSLEHEKNGNILYTGENVILMGSGFGCSGRVIFELGEYGRLLVEDIEWLREGEIKFTIPSNFFDMIEDAGFRVPDNMREQGVRASIYFVSGTMVSNAVTVNVKEPVVGNVQQGVGGKKRTDRYHNYLFY